MAKVAVIAIGGNSLVLLGRVQEPGIRKRAATVVTQNEQVLNPLNNNWRLK